MIGNLQRLEAFYWAARLGGFGAAAAHLGLTQPSISVRIKELEREVGSKLFYRVGRNVRVSDQGVAMFDYVERVLTLMQDLEGHVRRRGPLRGLVRLGVPDSFALLCLADLLKSLDGKHPELNVAVTVDNSRALGQKLEEGALDLAIMTEPPGKLVRMEYFGPQAVSWVASPSFRKKAQQLAPADLVAEQIVTNPAPSPTFSLIMDWFDGAGLIPKRLSTCNSVATIMELVSSGAAISVLPICILREQLRKKTMVMLNFAPPLPPAEMFAAYPKNAISRAIPEVIKLARIVTTNKGFVAKVTGNGARAPG